MQNRPESKARAIPCRCARSPLSVDRLAEALRTSTLARSEVDRAPGYHLPESARLAVLTAGLDLSSWVPPATGRRMSPPSKLGVAAARMAVEDAGLVGEVGGPRTAVVMSTTFGAVRFTERLLRSVMLEGPETASPFLFTESVANVAAAQIAIASQAQGPNLTVAQREAGVLIAVGRGAAEVAAGRADRALVGSVEEMPPLLHALLDRFCALARPGETEGEVARPFDRRRNGFLAGEGAVVLVLGGRLALEPLRQHTVQDEGVRRRGRHLHDGDRVARKLRQCGYFQRCRQPAPEGGTQQ